MGVIRFGGLGILGRVAVYGAALVACAGGAASPSSAPSVPLRFRGTPADATVTIDDQRVGSLALLQARGVRVLPGRHRITVEASGYLPFDVAIDARVPAAPGKDAVVPVDVALVPVPE